MDLQGLTALLLYVFLLGGPFMRPLLRGDTKKSAGEAGIILIVGLVITIALGVPVGAVWGRDLQVIIVTIVQIITCLFQVFYDFPQ